MASDCESYHQIRNGYEIHLNFDYNLNQQTLIKLHAFYSLAARIIFRHNNQESM